MNRVDRFTAIELAKLTAIAIALGGFIFFGGPGAVAGVVTKAAGALAGAGAAQPALAVGIGLVAVGSAAADPVTGSKTGEQNKTGVPAGLPAGLELLGILEEPMSEVRPRVIMDRKFGADQKLWSAWRNLNNGSIIRIDDEELELTGGGDVARFVDRGVNGTTAQAHAKGAKVYLVKAAPAR